MSHPQLQNYNLSEWLRRMTPEYFWQYNTHPLIQKNKEIKFCLNLQMFELTGIRNA